MEKTFFNVLFCLSLNRVDSPCWDQLTTFTGEVDSFPKKVDQGRKIIAF